MILQRIKKNISKVVAKIKNQIDKDVSLQRFINEYGNIVSDVKLTRDVQAQLCHVNDIIFDVERKKQIMQKVDTFLTNYGINVWSSVFLIIESPSRDGFQLMIEYENDYDNIARVFIEDEWAKTRIDLTRENYDNIVEQFRLKEIQHEARVLVKELLQNWNDIRKNRMQNFEKGTT